MGDFEKDLRDAFEGVEFTPSEEVWMGVERGLRPRKKGIFFMWQTYGVAATLLFVLTMGYLFRDELFSSGAIDPVQRELTQNKESLKKEGENTATTNTDSAEKTDEPTSEPKVNDQVVQDATPGINDLQASHIRTDMVKNPDDDQPQVLNLRAATDQPDISAIDPTIATQEVGDTPEELLIDPTFMGPLTLGDLKESIAIIKAKWDMKNLVEPLEIEASEEEQIASLPEDRRNSLNGSFGSSVFNPNSTLNNADLALTENAVDDPRFSASQLARSSDASESQLGSISVGFGLGLPLGDRWIFKTGLRYSQYRFASISNAYSVENGEELPIYTRVAFDNSEVFLAGEYEITNTLHSVQIPAQFGWKFLDLGRFDSWINVGVAADYIVSYTVKGDLNFLEERQVDFSQSSFINRFNLNAITGLEFTYELNSRFALSGEVFFRQYVPISNSDGAYAASPSVLGFGLGVNYYLGKKK